MADINRIFKYLEDHKLHLQQLRNCKTLMVCPVNMRKELTQAIDREIKFARAGKKAAITLKLNALSDVSLINKIYDAAAAGVEIKMVIRSIICAKTENKRFKKKITAVSIVDEYLEHARVLIFHNGGNEKYYISSADWMVRNLDHRVEAAILITSPNIQKELKDIINIQLEDNVKARVLDNQLLNHYVPSAGKKKIRSQTETYQYLHAKLQLK